MKKKIILLVVFITAFIVGFNVKSHAQKDVLEGIEYTPIGQSIDTVKADSYGDFRPYNVLDFDYYKNLKRHSCNCTYTVTNTFYSTNKGEVFDAIAKEEALYTNIDGTIVEMFPKMVNERFEKFDKYVFASNLYVCTYGKVKFGSASMSLEEKNELKNHLSDYYLTTLEDLSNSKLSYDTFFKRYGTHLITNYDNGHLVEVNYEIGTNSKFITGDMAKEMAMDLSFNVNEGEDFDSYDDFFNKYGLEKTKTFIYGNPRSSSPNIMLPVSKNNFTEWVKKCTADNGTIVSYGKDGLLPLWEFLPDNSPVSRETMKNEYIKYAQNNTYKVAEKEVYEFPDEMKGKKSISSKDFVYEITDRDRFYNRDIFNISEKYGISCLKDKYKYIDITVKLDYKKKDNGNRYLYLYDASDAYQGSKEYNKYITYTKDIKCKKKKWYQDKEITFTIPLERLDSTELALVWRASGKGKDTWMTRNVSVEYRLYN